MMDLSHATGARARAAPRRRRAGVVVVDDSRVFRTGMTRAVQACEGLELLGEADDGASALAAIADLEPDLVILDLRMPGIDGFGVLDALRSQDPPATCRVLVISATLEDGVEEEVRAAGADGVMSKALSRSDICAEALRVLAR
jgi:DNA-binding NarL/FixJ family response regulator